MPRSLKKGPFVDDHLLAKVDAQNEKGTKNVIRTCRAMAYEPGRSPSSALRRLGRESLSLLICFSFLILSHRLSGGGTSGRP